MNVTPPVIHVVDDDEDFGRAMGRLLQAGGYQVQLHQSGESFLQSSPPSGPGCILLDLQMAGIDGLELQGHLAEREDQLPIIFLSGNGDIPKTVQALKSGADDFLCKPVARDVLFRAVETALARYEEVRNEREQLNSLWRRLDQLTPREREVFDLVVRGKLNKQIAFELGAAERTIKAHRRGIVVKLKVRSPAELASLAERLGIIDRVPTTTG